MSLVNFLLTTDIECYMTQNRNKLIRRTLARNNLKLSYRRCKFDFLTVDSIVYLTKIRCTALRRVRRRSLNKPQRINPQGA